MRKLLRIKIVEHFDTQEKLAKASGIDESIISKLVRDMRDPTGEQSEILARLLKTDAEQLFRANDNA
jgi:transcriptional regulator with XRE-family HTH domain